MAHWPKTIVGRLFALLLTLAAVPLVLWVSVSLSGPVVWASLGIVAIVCVVLYLWRQRAEAARERAWVGAFSFGDVVERMRANDALELPAP